MELLIKFNNEDEAWMFERTVQQLQKDYDHTKDEAVDLLNKYHEKFTDPEFCKLHKIAVQTTDFFCHEESLAMADRVQFYEALKNAPDEIRFVQWQRSQRLN
jgi:hypothetical protein